MRNSVLPFLLVFAFLRCGLSQTASHPAAIPQHTEVEIELIDSVSSETLHSGQPVAFKIVRPVVVNGKRLLAADTPVSGEVAAVKASGAWRKAGSFDLRLKPIQMDDGSIVQLDFHRPERLGTKMEKTGAAVEKSFFLTYYFPLIPVELVKSAKKGKPYNIRSGERYLVYVVSSTTCSEAPQATTGPPKP